MISLLSEDEKWVPIRRVDGRSDWVPPFQIAEPDVVGFAASRADFNSAIAQFMIGLLQTVSPASTEREWEKLYASPPTRDELAKWFAPFVDAFTFDGDKARFMQDRAMDGGAECGIDALLIDAPGGSAVDKNTDLFVKRNTVTGMCPHCAATALFTLQTNAPAGGAGHRTSLRGGGPLTTLVVASPSKSLWHDLWLNVLPQNIFLARSGDRDKEASFFTFPWLAEVAAIQPNGTETQPVQVHPHHVFWAMPRRIRLDFDDVKSGQCSICKRTSGQLVHRYATKPQGLNYKGPWRHPFSPYYETKEGWLPVHPQPGGFGYRHWLAWTAGSPDGKQAVQAAAVAGYVASERAKYAKGMRLWVCGFDMDNMKPRCWYETTYPLYDLAGCKPSEQKAFYSIVGNMIGAAQQVVYYLRQAVKLAWFGEADMRGDLGFVDKMFWDSTEPAFYRQIKGLIDQASSEAGIGRIDEEYAQSQVTAWHAELSKKALRLFDRDIVGAGTVTQQDPHRIARAYKELKYNLDGKALRALLGLPAPVADKAPKAGKRKPGKPDTPAAQPS